MLPHDPSSKWVQVVEPLVIVVAVEVVVVVVGASVV